MKNLMPIIFFIYVFLLLALIAILGCEEGDIAEPIEGVFFGYDQGSVETQLPALSPPPEIQVLLWGDEDAYVEQFKDVLDDGIIETDRGPVHDTESVMPAYFRKRIAEIRARKAYYTKYIDAGGVAIIGNAYISDRYFYAAREIVFVMTAKHPQLREHMALRKEKRPKTTPYGDYRVLKRIFALVLFHTDQGFNSLPEYKDTKQWSIGFCGLERCVSPVQLYPGKDIMYMSTFVHEFAHTMHWAILMVDPTFQERLDAAYADVVYRKNSYWGGNNSGGTAVLSSSTEYWAYTATRWFFQFTLPTRFGEQHHKRFWERDPLMYALMQEWFDFQYLGYIKKRTTNFRQGV